MDSSVFINAKYDFNRGAFLNLKKYCDDGIVILFTNDIILREVKHHIKFDVGLAASQAKNVIEKHFDKNGEVLNAVTPTTVEVFKSALLDSTNQLIAAFDAYMGRVEILSNEHLSVVELFNDYFNFTAPFENKKEKKSEFPDAAVIMSIKQYLNSMPLTTLYVVTDDNGWHRALNGVQGIVMYKDIKTLLTTISKERELYENIVSYIGAQINALVTQSEDWLNNQEWDFVVDEISTCIECDAMDEVIVEIIDLALDSIEYIDKEDGYANAVLMGIANVKLGFSYIDHERETYDKEDHTWYNTAYGDGEAEVVVPISLSVKVLLSNEPDNEIELAYAELDELNKENIEIMDYKLTEHDEYPDEPTFNICPDCGKMIGLHNDGRNGFCVDCAPKH